jgi:hypothetical protein
MSTTSSRDMLQLTALLGDFRLLLILFAAFRLLLLMIYQPLVIDGIERGVAAGGDFPYYHALASMTSTGLWPFRDWWHEFPPLASTLYVAVYRLSGGSYGAYAMLFGAIMLAFDVGNLALLRRIGTRLHGANTGMALAWIYAVMLAPAVFIWWNFEPMVVCFTLLGLWWLLRGDNLRSAVIVAIGTLTKFTPALLLGAVWRFRPQTSALRYTAIIVGLFALVYALLFAQNAAMTAPSLTAQFSKASYETVWALLDGNYSTGNFGTVASHLDPTQANVIQGNPSVVPGILRLALAGAVGLFVFASTRRFDERGLVAFVTITLLIFFLQSQGWSVQWLAQIIPLVLLCFPTRDSVIILVLLSLVAFAEYPLLFIRTGDMGGVISGPLVMPFVVLVLARTALLVGLCVGLYQQLRRERSPEGIAS